MAFTSLSAIEIEKRRDAKKYRDLSRALKRIASKLQSEEVYADIDEVLGQLLQDLALGADADQAFVAKLEETSPDAKRVRFTAAYPLCPAAAESFESETLITLFRDQMPRIIDPGTESPPLIPGLEIIGARTAILIYLETLEGARVVGVCNRRDLELGQFLAPDMFALSDVIHLMIVGARIVERQRGELERVQRACTELHSQEDLQLLYSLIVAKAVEVFSPDGVSLLVWNRTQTALVAVAHDGLSTVQQESLYIPKAHVDEQMKRIGGEKLLSADLPNPLLFDSILSEETEFSSVHSAPLLRGRSEELLGFLQLYQKHGKRPLGSYEQQLLEAFAAHAAAGIKNAQLYESVQSERLGLNAIYKIGGAITQTLNVAGSAISQTDLEAKTLLQTILEQAVRATNAYAGTIQLLDDEKKYLHFVAATPAKRLQDLKEQIPMMPLDGKGITVRAVKENHAQLSRDVDQDQDFVPFFERTHSELAVVLRRTEKGEPFGVLNIEHEKSGGIDDSDRFKLIALANTASIAIQILEQAEQQRRFNMVAVMGAWGADIVHTVRDGAGAIQAAVIELLHQDLPYGARRVIQDIEGFAKELTLPELPEQAPVVGESLEMQDTTRVNEVVSSEIEKLRRTQPSIELRVVPGLDEPGPDERVAMQEQWLRLVLRNLIDNSIRSIHEVRDKGLVTIRIGVEQGSVKIEVEDNGKGVRPEIEALLLKKPVPHIGRRENVRAGRSLLLVGFIIEQHGGHIQLDWSEEGVGARFSFSIPIVPKVGSDFYGLGKQDDSNGYLSRVLIIDPQYYKYFPLGIERGCVRAVIGEPGTPLDQTMLVAQDFRPHVVVIDLDITTAPDRTTMLSDDDLKVLAYSTKCILYSNKLTVEMADYVRQRYNEVEVIRKYEVRSLLELIDRFCRERHAQREPLSILWSSDEQWNSQQVIYALFGVDATIRYDLIDDVLHQLFRGRPAITLESLVGNATPQSPKKKRSVVMKVSSAHVDTVVVKLAPSSQIRREYDRYSRYIEDPKHREKGTPIKGHHVARLDHHTCFWDVGGTVFSFVGAGDQSRLQSFAKSYLGQSEADKILKPLEYFFKTVWSLHYEAAVPSQKTLFELYEQVLGEENQSLEERLEEPQRSSFFRLPAGFTDLPDPVAWILQHKGDSLIPSSKQVVVHGDLHGENLFVDGTYAWAIDFERTGEGHSLHDFAELEIDIITHMLPWDCVNLNLFYRLAELLTSRWDPSANPSIVLSEHSDLLDNPEIVKAVDVVNGLRCLAYDVTHYSEYCEYLWGLLVHSLYVCSIRILSQEQRDRATILSSVICKRLMEQCR